MAVVIPKMGRDLTCQNSKGPEEIQTPAATPELNL
jgi:hypothetical protein